MFVVAFQVFEDVSGIIKSQRNPKIKKKKTCPGSFFYNMTSDRNNDDKVLMYKKSSLSVRFAV